MRISEWPLAERPREKLLAKGVAALSDAELVAVLLRSGVRGKSAVDLARDLLTQYAGVTHMLEAGAHLHTIQKLLGHKQITSTMVYLHLTHQTTRDALRLMDELCRDLPR